eukprot:scpid55036/ scgid9132/ 
MDTEIATQDKTDTATDVKKGEQRVLVRSRLCWGEINHSPTAKTRTAIIPITPEPPPLESASRRSPDDAEHERTPQSDDGASPGMERTSFKGSMAKVASTNC